MERKWHPIPAFWPGKSPGQRAMVSHRAWNSKTTGQDLGTEQQNKRCVKLISLIMNTHQRQKEGHHLNVKIGEEGQGFERREGTRNLLEKHDADEHERDRLAVVQ